MQRMFAAARIFGFSRARLRWTISAFPPAVSNANAASWSQLEPGARRTMIRGVGIGLTTAVVFARLLSGLRFPDPLTSRSAVGDWRQERPQLAPYRCPLLRR